MEGLARRKHAREERAATAGAAAGKRGAAGKASRAAPAPAPEPRATAADSDEDADADEAAYSEAAALELFILDVEHDKARNGFLLWCVTHDAAAKVCVRVEDFTHSCHVRAPNGRPLDEDDLDALRAAIAARCAGVAVELQLCAKTPLMYFRPAAAGPSPFLRLAAADGSHPRRLAAAAARVAADEDGTLAARGLTWRSFEAFEADIKPLQRFLADSELCGGGWMRMAVGCAAGAVLVPRAARQSRCSREYIAPWTALTSLTPDAAQLSDAAHAATLAALLSAGGPAADAAAAGQLPPLVCCMLDVQLACAPTNGKGAAAGPPTRTPNAATDPVILITCLLAPLPHGGAPPQPTARVAFTWCSGGSGGNGSGDSGNTAPPGVELRTFATERAMLTAWSRWLVEEADPDIVVVFQVLDSISALLTRAEKLKMGPLLLGRHAAQAAQIKSMVQYSPAWVKAQQRMASTSNQECFKATLGGRLVFDVLRQVLTSHPLGTFTLGDCVLSLLGQPLEVLPPAALAGLCAGRDGGRPRLARYALRRAEVVGTLLSKLESITEAVEMARTCGITLPIVSYQAQMVRTHQLLLRAARRAGYVLGGQLDACALTASPYLIHPVEQGTAGLYREPVAVLDFASLYPSLFRAHNLCYTTLLHPSDAPGSEGAVLTEEDVFRSPTGALFVRPHVRKGLFPELLSALLAARAVARDALAAETDPERRAVLELRQRSLKLVANAAYGFTGANASPLQSVQLADSCLALGHAACRIAIEVLQAAPQLNGARVIYAQTDSMFLHLAGVAECDAQRLGALAAQLVSDAFPPAMSVKFERVLCPFLLLHVNRYAGADQGTLYFKGVKAAWRQSAPFLRRLLTRCLELILVQRDVPAATAFAAAEIRRLLSGGVDLGELVMSGGLWRHTSADIARAAAAEAGESEVTGPHAALAVRLAARDPGRVRVLGERVPYVLLAGHKRQDDAAEDPVAALQTRAHPNAELYWSNKVETPLREIFAPVLDAEGMRELLGGPHTRVKATALQRDSTHGGAPRGMGGFFKPTARCLHCRQNVSAKPPPPLCDNCTADGRAQETLLRLLEDASAADVRLAAGDAACMRCHSGGLMHPILCANGDCPVLFARGKAGADAAEAREALARFNDW